MLFDGIKLAAGSEFQNLVVDSGSAFPADPDSGELFYRNDGANEAMYIYNGSAWMRQTQEGDSLASTLPDVGTPGTYSVVTVDSKGFVTGGSSPTTLAGYGISDGQPLDADLTAIGAISANAGLLRKTASNTWTLDTASYITGNQAITVTGDVSGSGSTSLTLNLSATGVAAGNYGTQTSVSTLAINSAGRITGAVNTPIVLDTSAITSGTMANARISSSSVTQHQTALVITESQIADGSILARVGANEVIGGTWTFSAAVSGQTPTDPAHLTTKSYVDNIAAGVTPQKSVKVATTGNITLSGAQTIDGVGVTAGDRVLVKDQTTGSQNGIYVVSAGAWTRSTDFDGNPTTEIQTGSLSFVESGTTNGNSSWILVTSGTIVVNSTPLVFTIFSRAGDYLGGSGLTKVGNTFNVGTANSSRIVVAADDIDLATSGVVAGTYSKITVDSYGRATTGTNIASGDVTTALGFTPYNATNPAAYITAASNVASATVLQTARTISLTGDATGTSAAFNGSANASIAVALADVGTPVTNSFVKITTDTKGRVTSTTAVVAGDIPTLNQNTTGTAANVSGTVSIANGGTGQTTAEAAIDALGGAAINPVTPKDGDIRVQAGPIISIYATGAYRQIFPAVYS